MAKTQRKDFSRMFMGVARSEAGVRVDPTTGAISTGMDWSKITDPISKATKEAKDNYDSKIKEQADKFDRNEIDLSKVPIALQESIEKWTQKMGTKYDEYNQKHAKYVNRARNCTHEQNQVKDSDCWHLNDALQGMNSVKTAFETLGAQKDQFLTWRTTFLQQHPELSGSNPDNIKFMYDALADSDFSYFTESAGTLNIDENGGMSFGFTLDGESGTINFSDFAGAESLRYKNRAGAHTRFDKITNELTKSANTGSLFSPKVSSGTKEAKKEYPLYYDKDVDGPNDHLYSTAYKNIEHYTNLFYEALTEDDFAVMIFDGATDWNVDGNPANDKQIVDTYLSGLFEQNKKEILKNIGGNFANRTDIDEALKDAMRVGIYWDKHGNILDTSKGADFRNSAISDLLRKSTKTYWEKHVEQQFDYEGENKRKAIASGNVQLPQ